MSVISFHWHLHPHRIQSPEPSLGVGKCDTVQWLSKSFVGLHSLLKLDHCAVRNLEISWTVENQGGMLLCK